MAERVQQQPGPETSWRRLLNFPVVAMIVAIALFLLAAAIGQAAGSAISLHSPLAKMLARNSIILAIVLLTYKLAIARLGASPRDDLTSNGALPDLAIGIGTGFLLMALSVGVAAIAHVYSLAGNGDTSELFRQLITAAIMPAFLEEMLFRGILFRWVEELAGSWAALLITSALFGLAHILNPHATWFSSFAIAVEAGLLLGGAYMLSRSLWLPIGLHAAWNFTQGEIFGVPVSGGAVHGLVKSRLAGPPLLSGGGFGLEASVIALLIATAAGAVFVWLAVRRGEVIRPLWARQAPFNDRSAPASPESVTP